jgi:hypothetical protein
MHSSTLIARVYQELAQNAEKTPSGSHLQKHKDTVFYALGFDTLKRMKPNNQNLA